MGGALALVGLVRVSAEGHGATRQHDVLDPICVYVFEEKVLGKSKVNDLHTGDMLAVWHVDWPWQFRRRSHGPQRPVGGLRRRQSRGGIAVGSTPSGRLFST